jgi:hypothetical protein
MTMAAPRVLLQSPADTEPVVRLMLATLQPLADALGAAAAEGLLAAGDVIERTICVFALLQGVLLLHKQARYAPTILDVDRLATRGTRGLLLGWGAKSRAVDAARRASTTITELLRTPYAPGETREDRALTVAAHARTLVEAFSIIDGIASSSAASTLFSDVACDCPSCVARANKPEPEPAHNPNAN